jgi:hypothetical protein
MQTRRTGAGHLPGPREWHAHALIGLLAVVFFREILLRSSFFWEDFLYQYYAFRTFAATSLAAGQLPLWNPYTFNGMPFQADIQSAIFYLPNLLLTPFAAGGTLDYWLVEVSIILHFALAGSGMYLLARHFGLERIHALFSAIAYAFSGFMVGHLIHQGFIYQAAWLPLIFLTFRKALLGRSSLYAILSGLLLGHALLAGAPQITLYIVLFLFLYFLFELGTGLRSGGWKAAAGIVPFAAVPIVIAALVTAVQLLPTAELAPLSQRAELSYEKATEGSLEPAHLITLAVPKYFGSSGARGSNYQRPGPYWEYWETQGYIGVAALVLAIVAVAALRKTPVVWFLAGSIVFGFLYGLGGNFFLHKFFHEYVPGFERFRVPGRMVLYYCFAGSLLAGFGVREIAAAVSAGRVAFTKKVALWTAAGAAALFVAGQAGLFVSPLPGQTGAAALEAGRIAAAESAKAAGILIITAGLVFAAGRKSISLAVFGGLLLTLQFADVHVFGFDQNNGATNPDAYFARTSRVAQFFREKGEREYFRVNSREGGAMLLDRNEGMIDRLFLMEGYTPLGLARFIPPMDTWARTCDLMNAKYRIAVDHAKNSMTFVEAQGYAPRAFVVHRGTLVSTAEAAKAKIADPAFDPMREAVFESAPPALYDAPGEHGSSASIESYRLNEIRVRAEADADGYLVLSEVWYPGWRATVDGAEAPVLRADWCLRAVPIAAGKHEVVLEFSPSSFRTGAWISSLSFALAVAGIAYIRKKENG